MKISHIFLTAVLLTGFSSCKDFLDVKPSNAADAANAIQTPADAQVLIAGLMRSMTSSDYYGRNFILYGDAKGGDLTIVSQGRGQDVLYTFNHSATSNNYGGFWSQIYSCIAQTNYLLEGIAKIQTNTATNTYDTYKGQALTARALLYFDLVRLYGKSYTDDKTAFGVPSVITTLGTDAQSLRSTVEQNYTQILIDLKAAAPLLPKTKQNGYINYYANLAIQARVYLTMGDYPNALKAAEEVINATSIYPGLYTNGEWVDSWKSAFGKESVLELGIYPLEGDLTTASLGVYLRRKSDGGSAVLGFFMASDYFINRIKQDPADVRLGIMSYDEISNTRLGAIYKYSGSTALFGDGKGSSTAVNIKVIRLSEMYLIASEAALPTDKIKAANYLNAIRKRSPSLVPATNLTINMDMILDERSKELVGEGQRFFDLIRLNKSITFNDEIAGITPASRPKTIDRTFNKTRLPIPDAELNANPGLRPQQNAGY
ncbi:RagB/SusD family nutrient uptake outer membrane protein [Pedobacter sp. MC2016-24]|uniref:RagB/SusD family nutrient uptake outer membrane protein n=1 Tax=Pedobacter sp. MC2016-24 TaxID=2780090 RepID=UPI00187FEE88|nr:RagB/SusD family nutrient uptake outer membrane protein [Pedobacter sp. MC2016-24]MBE9600910.1 RagB/SusD family nutrient uptake outer membrane protein [Pedobacter sp. MC2016-24]